MITGVSATARSVKSERTSVASARNVACPSGRMFRRRRRRGLLLEFLCPLPEVKLKLLGRVDSLFDQQRVHRIDSGPEALVARQVIHRLFKADQALALRNIGIGTLRGGGHQDSPLRTANLLRCWEYVKAGFRRRVNSNNYNKRTHAVIFLH